MSGLASGIMELRSVVGRADMPVMHFARPVFWLSFTRIISQRRSNRIEAPQKQRYGWRARLRPPSESCSMNAPSGGDISFTGALYGDIALDIAADLLIADSERRCAAVLLRLSGRRFADPDVRTRRRYDHPARFGRRRQLVAKLGPKHAAAAGVAWADRTGLPRHRRPRPRRAPRLRR